MKKIIATLFTVLVLASSLHAASLRAGPAYAFTEDVPDGTHLWCAFPDVPSRWTVVLYARDFLPPTWWHERNSYTYTPIAAVTKPAGASGAAVYQLLTVPPHTKKVCLLVVYRNNRQQPYRGWTAFNPYGWHTFGVIAPLEARVAEIPQRVPAKAIANYQRLMQSQWNFPLPQPRFTTATSH